MTRCKIYIFRHAESADNARKLFSGWRDPPLTAKGKAESRKIAKQIREKKIGLAFTTTRKRASDTLRIALGKRLNIIPLIIDDRLIERSYGALQGTSKTEIAKKLGEKEWQRVHRGYDNPPPKGESIAMVAKRVNPFIKELEAFLRKYPCDVAISCHGNSMRPLRKHYQHLTKKQTMALENPQDKYILVNYDVKGKRKPLPPLNEILRNFPGRRIVKVLLPRQLKPPFPK